MIKVSTLDTLDREDGWIIVRGASSDHEAWEAARKEVRDIYLDDERPDPVLVRAGKFRWNPCNENSCWDGGGHRVHLGYAHGELGSWTGWLYR